MSEVGPTAAGPPHESVLTPGNVDVAVAVVAAVPMLDDGECSGVVSSPPPPPIDGASAQALCRDRKPSISVTEYADGQQAPDAAAARRAAAAAAADGVRGAWADPTGDLDPATATAAAAAAAAHALPTGYGDIPPSPRRDASAAPPGVVG